MAKRVGWVLAFLALLAVLLGVWPTLYRPIAIHEISGGSMSAARQNRVTGRVQWLERGGDFFQ